MKTEPAALDTQSISDRVCADRGWQLIDYPEVGCGHPELAQRAEARARAWRQPERTLTGPDELLERATIYEYNRLLHAAAQMDDCPAVQDRALTETWNYILPIIRRCLDDAGAAGECAHEALLAIWEHGRDVRDPGAFLAWAGTIAQRQAWRRAGGPAIEIALQGDADEREDGDVQIPDPGQPDPLHALLSSETRTTLLSAVKTCLKRMRYGAWVIIGEFLDGQEPEELAAGLGLTRNYIYGIKRRALLKLRECPRFIALLAGVLVQEQAGGATC